MKFILGKKLPMTQVWVNDKVVAVTPVLAGPCTVTQVKTSQVDGYNALQVSYGIRKEKNIKKPQLGHFKKAGVKPQAVRELRAEVKDAKIGDVVTVETFSDGDIVDVTATSKGKGFQGVVKRYGFQGGRKTHGNKDQLRMGGSIGAKGPAHVFKGTRMGGRMGGERVTIKNLEIIKIDEENNLLFVKGAIPGAVNGLITIKGQGELKFSLPAEPVSELAVIETEVVVEPTLVETVVEEKNKEVIAEAPVEATEEKTEKVEAISVAE